MEATIWSEDGVRGDDRISAKTQRPFDVLFSWQDQQRYRKRVRPDSAGREILLERRKRGSSVDLLHRVRQLCRQTSTAGAVMK